MSTKPTLDDTRWAVTGGGADATNLTTPTSGEKDTGYPVNAVPTSGKLNWLFRKAQAWFQYLTDGNLQGAHTFNNTVGVTGLITASAGVTFASNQNLTLAGTGYIKTGSRTITVPISSSFGCIQQGGTLSTATGAGAKPGCAFAVSSTGLIPIPLIFIDGQRALISAVTVHGAWTGTGNITTQLMSYIYSIDTIGGIGPSTGQAINSALTANPTTPFNPAAGDMVFVSVITAGTNSGKATSLEVTFTIP